MAKIKTTRVWNGLPIDEYTDTETGVVELYSQPTRGAMGSTTPGTLFATGDDKGKWSYNDQSGFRRGYNNKQRTQGKPTLTQEDFNKKFFTEGTKIVNNDRAAVLNNIENYTGVSQSVRNKVSFSENGIPGVINPETGLKNNSNGDSVVDSDNNTDEEEVAGSEQGGNPSDTSDSSSTLGGEKDFGSNTNSFRYPIGILPDLDYDFIQFIACEYKAGGFTDLTTSGNIEARVGPSAETITLPMIPALSESSQVGWGGDKLNELQAAGARIATNAIKAGDGFNIGAAAAELVNSTQKEANAILNNNPGLKDAIISYFAGQAVGANILTRQTGSVLNPNLELLFQGPSLRSFNFNFKFRPRDPDEAKMVRSIIRVFKRNMAVQRKKGELFLYTPNIFKIKYLHKGGDHPFMNRLMPCACTSFNVVYTPDNNYMTYADGSMTGYDVSFTMAEIVPIYADHQKDAGGTGF